MLLLASCATSTPRSVNTASGLDTVPLTGFVSVPARDARDSALIQGLARLRQVIDSLPLHDNTALTRIARFPSGTLALVPGSEEWPDSTQVAYELLRDSLDRPRSGLESPGSRSGDWYLVTTHYFDTTGATFMVERHASFFSGCWDEKGDSMVGLRETLTSYYAQPRRLLGRAFVRTTFDTTIAPPSDNCNPAFQEPFPVYSSWSSFANATGLGQLLGPSRSPD
jgi:hypothetical protein